MYRVLFINQRTAERMRPPRRCALISITDCGAPPAQVRSGWSAIHRACFDDADPITFPGMNPHLSSMQEEQAADLAQYVISQIERCTRVVVHCRHGISRSGAVAKAIAEVVGAAFPSSYAEYNHHVYLLVRRALAEQRNAA